MSCESLQEKLGHRFTDLELLREALTHPSYGHERRTRGADNQRLEFLGDAVLQLAVTERLYLLFPDLAEGRLTKLRAQFVNRARLQTLAEALGLGAELILGRGEEANAGRARGSNLADAMEAVIGAVYRDAGWPAAHDFVLRLLEPSLQESCHEGGINPKGELQELLQATGKAPPQYQCVGESGPPHARQFEVTVEWEGRELGRGQGPSKKEAEIHAARAALETLEKEQEK